MLVARIFIDGGLLSVLLWKELLRQVIFYTILKNPIILLDFYFFTILDGRKLVRDGYLIAAVIRF